MKKRITSAVIILLGVLAANASAQSFNQPEAINNIYNCRDIESDSERLACYDSAVNRLEDAQKSGDVVAISKTDVEKVERDAFGFNIPSLPKLGKIFGSGKKSNSTKDVAEAESESRTLNSETESNEPEFGELKGVKLEIRKTDTFGYNRTRFFFSNGQVWEQVHSKKLKIRKASKDQPNFAEISKASLGSYLLKINGQGSAVRVKRVR